MKSLSIILSLFLSETQAIQFRPYVNGRTPWYHRVKYHSDADEYPVNYYVPDFGDQDSDVRDTLHHTSEAEKRLKKKFALSSFKYRVHSDQELLDHPINYHVNDFGVDRDIVNTEQHMHDAEDSLDHIWSDARVQAGPPPPPPRDYFVPNFGPDREVQQTLHNLNVAEDSLDHRLEYFDYPHPKKQEVEYDSPRSNLGMDHDVATTLQNAENAETAYGQRIINPDLLQEFEEFNLRTGGQHTPAEAASLLQSLEEIHLGKAKASDPVCSSAGCQSNHPPKMLDHPINYKVPDYGIDHDTKHTMKSVEAAEDIVGHKWEFGTDKSKAKWKALKEAGATPYDHNPSLDHDVVSTQDHLKNAEDTLGHKLGA